MSRFLNILDFVTAVKNDNGINPDNGNSYEKDFANDDTFWDRITGPLDEFYNAAKVFFECGYYELAFRSALAGYKRNKSNLYFRSMLLRCTVSSSILIQKLNADIAKDSYNLIVNDSPIGMLDYEIISNAFEYVKCIPGLGEDTAERNKMLNQFKALLDKFSYADRKDAAANYLLYRYYEYMHQEDEALNELKKEAEKQIDRSPCCSFEYGKYLFEMGRYVEAEKQFEKSAINSKGKEKIESHCFFARALYYSNCNEGKLSSECDPEQIIKEFKKAMGLAYSYCQAMKDNSLLLEIEEFFEEFRCDFENIDLNNLKALRVEENMKLENVDIEQLSDDQVVRLLDKIPLNVIVSYLNKKAQSYSPLLNLLNNKKDLLDDNTIVKNYYLKEV